MEGSLSRRSVLIGGALGAAALPLMGTAVLAKPQDTLSPLAAAAREAWLYGLVLIEMAGSRERLLRAVPPNRLFTATKLTTPATQTVTTPNNDTIYASSWINLSSGPVSITLPRAGSRYLSVAFMDMYSNNFAILGTRTTGGDGGKFTLVGPMDATTDPLAIRSPTPWVWMLSRLLVDNEADLAAANAVHAQLKVEGPAAARPNQYAGRSAPWNEYFDSVQRLIMENPPPATDAALFRRVAPLGISPRGGFDAHRYSAAQIQEIEAGIAAAKQSLRSTNGQGKIVNGWIYPKINLGDFGQDYFYRAQIALGGLAALPRAEAMYMWPVNDQGTSVFDSSLDWKWTLPGNRMPPVDAFWSLTMYEATDDGHFFFFDNPINRYAIGDRTPGFMRNGDGGVTIWMSRTNPVPERRANWLPLPPRAPFRPVFRAYIPQADLVEGVYQLPPFESA